VDSRSKGEGGSWKVLDSMKAEKRGKGGRLEDRWVGKGSMR